MTTNFTAQVSMLTRSPVGGDPPDFEGVNLVDIVFFFSAFPSRVYKIYHAISRFPGSIGRNLSTPGSPLLSQAFVGGRLIALWSRGFGKVHL